VVADGHGGGEYFRSALGSRFAVEAARDNIAVFTASQHARFEVQDVQEDAVLPPESEFKKLLGQLVKSIVASWYAKVEEHFQKKPFTAEELSPVSEKRRKLYGSGDEFHHAYGTTLIACAVTASYWFGIHIGDGKCLVLDKNGGFSQPIPWDERCFLNKTTSLCDGDAADSARVFFSYELPAVVFLGTDGVDDSYPVSDVDTHLERLYHRLAVSFAEETVGEVRRHLEEFLPTFSQKGSGDDVSIAGLIDIGAVKELTLKNTVQTPPMEENK
jgi:hypothetical protein